MSNNKKIIIISFVSLVFVLGLVIGITKAFMKPIEQGGNITEVSLNSCAKIKLTSTSNVNLSSSYPMSRNKGLQTTPYKFTVTSYCDSYVGFNLYVATLNTNTIDAKYVRYILTETGTKNVIQEGILSSAINGVSDFTDTEKTELNTGLKGTYGSIYKIHSENIPLKGTKSFDIYLFLDGDVADNSTMGKTFKAGIAVKSYDREKNMAVISEACSNGQNLADCIKSTYSYDSTLYYHDSSLTNGAGDNSYRYAGASERVNNFVCFGSNENSCPTDNLYRIIGVFGNNVKLIKYDYANWNLLGTDGDYQGTGNGYFWNYKNNTSINNGYGSNEWGTSLFNKINLNKNYLNNIGTTWSNLIEDTTWKVSGHTTDIVTPKAMFTAEITNATKTYGPENGTSKIGLMYASDYGFAAAPSAWTTNLHSYNSSSITSVNWMNINMKIYEWTITPYSSYSDVVFLLTNSGYLFSSVASGRNYVSRPVLYLKASVNYVSGSGTAADPILVN